MICKKPEKKNKKNPEIRSDKFGFIDEKINKRILKNQFRKLKVLTPISEINITKNGKKLINFCSNDYLGLSKHRLIKQRASEYLEKYGAGSTASRLICGTYEYYDDVEKKLAYLKQTEKTLILGTGFQANVSVIPCLADKNSLIISDTFIHNSLIQGILLSRCKKISFKHNDMDDLERLLKENYKRDFSSIIIVTESVFSMDGDIADIDNLEYLSETYGAILIVDEAHATGVFGVNGMGLSCGKNVDVVIGTFGKACGSFGSYIATSKKIYEYFINFCYGFIYSTALPPSVFGSIDAALDLIPTLEAERQKINKNADFLRQSLNNMGFSTDKSKTQIIPVIIGSEEKTLSLAKFLEEHNIFAIAIRPPTIPENLSRIRISLSCHHSHDDILYLVSIFKKWKVKAY